MVTLQLFEYLILASEDSGQVALLGIEWRRAELKEANIKSWDEISQRVPRDSGVSLLWVSMRLARNCERKSEGPARDSKLPCVGRFNVLQSVVWGSTGLR